VYTSCATRFARTLPSGAPARAIQELARHKDLSVTQRYMHMSPATLDAAIRLLDLHGPADAGHYIRPERGFGDMRETGTQGGKTINKSGH
jgi:hypothetical protein